MYKNHFKLHTLIIPILASLFNVFLIIYPQEVLAAAREGLLLWFNNILPSLLPFMIGINILSGTGFIRFLSVLSAPVMNFLFKLPGAGGFALLSGFTSGYPVGAKVITELRLRNEITKKEAQHLLGFCNNAGPLFIIGVVGTGMFGSASAGYCLWFAHIAAAFCVGFLLRIWKQNTETSFKKQNIFKQSLREFHRFRHEQSADFGKILSASVANSMETITLIGGFVILFCVLIKILTVIGILNAHFPLCYGLLSGVIESTNGVKALAAAGIRLKIALPAAAAIISFGGFSIHAQTVYFVRQTDIKIGHYLAAKLLNAVLAAFFCSLLYPLFFAMKNQIITRTR